MRAEACRVVNVASCNIDHYVGKLREGGVEAGGGVEE
jgi:hypothetical protein